MRKNQNYKLPVILALVIALLGQFSGSTATAQSQGQKMPATSDLLKQAQGFISPDQNSTNAKTLDRAGMETPGDTPIFAIVPDAQHPRVGQTVKFTLVPNMAYQGNLALIVVEYPAGVSGQYDGTVSVNTIYPQLGGGGNYITNVGLDQIYRTAWQMDFRAGTFPGVHQVHLLVFDTNGWVLKQQVWTNLCYVNCGPWPSVRTIASAQRTAEPSTSPYKWVRVTGQFPIGVPLVFVQGGVAASQPSYSKDGMTAYFLERSLGSNANQDVTVLIQAWRTAYTLNDAYWQPKL